MIIRMFRYGFERAVKVLNIENYKNKNITERVLLNLDVLYNKHKIEYEDYDEMLQTRMITISLARRLKNKWMKDIK